MPHMAEAKFESSLDIFPNFVDTPVKNAVQCVSPRAKERRVQSPGVSKVGFVQCDVRTVRQDSTEKLLQMRVLASCG